MTILGHCINVLNYRYGLLINREVKMAGYWPNSFFACLWPETKSRKTKARKVQSIHVPLKEPKLKPY